MNEDSHSTLCFCWTRIDALVIDGRALENYDRSTDLYIYILYVSYAWGPGFSGLALQFSFEGQGRCAFKRSCESEVSQPHHLFCLLSDVQDKLCVTVYITV